MKVPRAKTTADRTYKHNKFTASLECTTVSKIRVTAAQQCTYDHEVTATQYGKYQHCISVRMITESQQHNNAGIITRSPLHVLAHVSACNMCEEYHREVSVAVSIN